MRKESVQDVDFVTQNIITTVLYKDSDFVHEILTLITKMYLMTHGTTFEIHSDYGWGGGAYYTKK